MTNRDYSALESILQRRSTVKIKLHFKLKPVEATCTTCNTGHKETHPNAA